MSETTKYNRAADLQGILWMVLAMAAFAIEDAFIKAASTSLPVGQVLVLFGLGGAICFAVIATAQKERLFSADVLSLAMRIRLVFEIIGRLFYVLAISLAPLSLVTVILQATPVVVVAGAAILFGEQVGWRRWTAVVVGLMGVLLIIQPGAESFTIYSLLAFIGMLGFAGRDLASRAAPASLSVSKLGLYGFLAIVVAGIGYSSWEGAAFHLPTSATTIYLLAAILAGVLAYSALMKAMRTGAVSAVTPFRYTRLLFGIALGMLVFGERLNFVAIFGCGLIVLSGLFIIYRNSSQQHVSLSDTGNHPR